MKQLCILKDPEGKVLAVFESAQKALKYIRDRQAQTRVNGAPKLDYDLQFVELNLSPEGKRY